MLQGKVNTHTKLVFDIFQAMVIINFCLQSL